MENEFNAKILDMLLFERRSGINSGVYGFTQRGMAYNSNKIEGSTLSAEQTDSLFQTKSFYSDDVVRAKDVEEASGHFAMFNRMLDTISSDLTEETIKQFHYNLKIGVFEDRANGYAVGEYKTRRNVIGSNSTCDVAYVEKNMRRLLRTYIEKPNKTLEDVARFHVEYECIHPFQDGNGRTGRMIIFRECLHNAITPFIIQDINKVKYIKALITASNTGNYRDLVSYFEEEQRDYYSQMRDVVL